MPDHTPTVLATARDVLQMLAALRRSFLISFGPVDVTAPHLSLDDREGWTSRLTFWSTACGCQAGLLLAMTAIGWCIAALPRSPGELPRTLLNAIAVVLASAVVGKITALAVARLVLVWQLTRLAQQLSRHEEASA